MPDTLFGTDFKTNPDLDLKPHSGWQNLKAALIRRLMQPRGGLWYDRTYGTDLRQFLNETITTRSLYELERLAALELEKDPRILHAEATATRTGHRAVHLAIHCETNAGPFDLIVHVDDLKGVTLHEP